MEVQITYFDGASYVFFSGYPKTLAEELGVTPLPTSVNAALRDGSILYLLDGNKMYQYTLSGTSPNFGYVYVNVFDWDVNGVGNPFSAVPGSPVPAPPSGVTALIADVSIVLAVQQKELYVYTKGTSYWEHEGTVTTPCD